MENSWTVKYLTSPNFLLQIAMIVVVALGAFIAYLAYSGENLEDPTGSPVNITDSGHKSPISGQPSEDAAYEEQPLESQGVKNTNTVTRPIALPMAILIFTSAIALIGWIMARRITQLEKLQAKDRADLSFTTGDLQSFREKLDHQSTIFNDVDSLEQNALRGRKAFIALIKLPLLAEFNLLINDISEVQNEMFERFDFGSNSLTSNKVAVMEKRLEQLLERIDPIAGILEITSESLPLKEQEIGVYFQEWDEPDNNGMAKTWRSSQKDLAVVECKANIAIAELTEHTNLQSDKLCNERGESIV